MDQNIKLKPGANSTNRRMIEHGGGLAVVFRAGESLEIEHCGEVIKIVACGKSGDNKYKLSFVGPRSFKIGSIIRRIDENM